MNHLIGEVCCTIDVLLMIMTNMLLDYHYDKLTFH